MSSWGRGKKDGVIEKKEQVIENEICRKIFKRSKRWTLANYYDRWT